MKNFYLLLFAGCITAAISCKKETVTTSTKLPETGSMKSTTSDQLVSGSNSFGIGGFAGLSTDQKMVLYNKLEIQYVRAQLTLKNFKGGIGGPQKLSNNGFKVILNLNWSLVPKKGDDKTPTTWPQDMNLYKQKLGEVLSKYKPDVAVIENEPTVDIFHKGPVEDYITELKNAIQVCKQYGVTVADGGIHVPLILQVRDGNLNNENAVEVKKLIAAYKTLDLDYVNIHCHGGDTYTQGSFEKAADYIRQQTGKPVICNEFSLAKSSTSLLKDMVNGLKQGDYKIALIFSANGDDRSVPLNKGTDLLPLGIDYRDMIK